MFSVKGFWNKTNGFGGDTGIDHFMEKNIWQCWAWAYNAYLGGFDPEYTAGELAENEQKNELYKYDSAEFDTIQEFLAAGKKEDGNEFMNTTQICNYLNSKNMGIIFSNAKLGRDLIRLGIKKSCLANRKKGYYVKKILELR